MTINRYRYFYDCAFDMFRDHLLAFVDRMAELDHAESTVKIYLSCINDVAKAVHAARITACDLDEIQAIELIAAMGWIPRDLCKVDDEALRALSRRAWCSAGASSSVAKRSCAPGIEGSL
jgi:hypothetical protein